MVQTKIRYRSDGPVFIFLSGHLSGLVFLQAIYDGLVIPSIDRVFFPAKIFYQTNSRNYILPPLHKSSDLGHFEMNCLINFKFSLFYLKNINFFPVPSSNFLRESNVTSIACPRQYRLHMTASRGAIFAVNGKSDKLTR